MLTHKGGKLCLQFYSVCGWAMETTLLRGSPLHFSTWISKRSKATSNGDIKSRVFQTMQIFKTRFKGYVEKKRIFLSNSQKNLNIKVSFSCAKVSDTWESWSVIISWRKQTAELRALKRNNNKQLTMQTVQGGGLLSPQVSPLFDTT